MSEDQLEKVSFEFIRYANCWEDAEVLLAGLDVNESSKVMSIGSAGDNCFSILSEGVKTVIAVDVSVVQLNLIRLKVEAIKQLDRNGFLEFMGFRPDTDRISTYDKLRSNISDEARDYWDSNQEAIENGLIHFGKFEQYFQLFKNDYFSKVHSQEMINELFRSKPAAEQAEWHDREWLTEEWIKLYRVFFGEKMMGDKGRDPEFLKYVEGSVADMMLERASNQLRSEQCQTNYFLYYILNNKFNDDYLPHYVRDGVYEKLQLNIDSLLIFNGLIDKCLDDHPDCTHFNLSDIFEYMDIPLFRTVAKDMIDRSADGAKFAYWNLMIPRSMAEQFPEDMTELTELSNRLHAEDKGYFYRAFLIDQKK